MAKTEKRNKYEGKIKFSFDDGTTICTDKKKIAFWGVEGYLKGLIESSHIGYTKLDLSNWEYVGKIRT